MNKTVSILVLIVVLSLIMVGTITYFVVNRAGNDQTEPVQRERGSSSSTTIFPAVIVPWIVIWSAQKSPTTPLTNVWEHCVKRQGEKREKAISPYLSRRLRESSKYHVLLTCEPERIKKVTQPDKTQPGEIVFFLKDGREYSCTTVKRDKALDGAGSTIWVLDDIRGHEFWS